MGELKKVKIDEIELYLNLTKAQFPELVRNSTYKEIALYIQDNFEIVCSESDIYLIHEPSIQQDMYDMETFYKTILN